MIIVFITGETLKEPYMFLYIYYSQLLFILAL